MDQLRAEYAIALRKRISDGIAPSIILETNWIEYAGGQHVCRIKVHGSEQVIHSLEETNDIYVRRGASNRKARPEEIRSKGARSNDLLFQ